MPSSAGSWNARAKGDCDSSVPSPSLSIRDSSSGVMSVPTPPRPKDGTEPGTVAPFDGLILLPNGIVQAAERSAIIALPVAASAEVTEIGQLNIRLRIRIQASFFAPPPVVQIVLTSGAPSSCKTS